MIVPISSICKKCNKCLKLYIWEYGKRRRTILFCKNEKGNRVFNNGILWRGFYIDEMKNIPENCIFILEYVVKEK